ncbi:hypothetical protein Dimus_029708 [Dionaea muscipula]
MAAEQRPGKEEDQVETLGKNENQWRQRELTLKALEVDLARCGAVREKRRKHRGSGQVAWTGSESEQLAGAGPSDWQSLNMI